MLTLDVTVLPPPKKQDSTKCQLSWEELVKHEPRLGALEAEVQVLRHRRGPCANAHWYGWIKPILSILVGWRSKHPNPLLRTSRAYKVAYARLYQALPDCAHGDGYICGWRSDLLEPMYLKVIGGPAGVAA